MKFAIKLMLAAAVLVFSGCVTNDFKVVDALKLGMSSEEAQATIKSFGFTVAQSLPRPVDGWLSERKTFDAIDWRAGREEARIGKKITLVEFYPVSHGLLGAGQLFLFYGEDGRIVNFYRYQIN